MGSHSPLPYRQYEILQSPLDIPVDTHMSPSDVDKAKEKSFKEGLPTDGEKELIPVTSVEITFRVFCTPKDDAQELMDGTLVEVSDLQLVS